MRRNILFFTCMAMMLAGSAQSFPPVIIYNYTPPQPAFALISIKPNNHQAFDKAPESVTISFTEAIDPDNSDLKVFDPYNNPITGDKNVPKDNSMSVNLPAKLYSGAYRVDWKGICGCQEHTSISGTSYFTVY